MCWDKYLQYLPKANKMSDEFSLLKSLNNPKSKERPLLPAGISYTPRTVIVEGKNILVHVPSREIETFDRMSQFLGLERTSWCTFQAEKLRHSIGLTWNWAKIQMSMILVICYGTIDALRAEIISNVQNCFN